MITTITQFRLLAPVSLDEAREIFLSTAPKYRDLPGLRRKCYLWSDDGITVGGVYLWDARRRRGHVYRQLARIRDPEIWHRTVHGLVRNAGRGRQPRERNSVGRVNRAVAGRRQTASRTGPIPVGISRFILFVKDISTMVTLYEQVPGLQDRHAARRRRFRDSRCRFDRIQYTVPRFFSDLPRRLTSDEAPA